MGLTNKMGLPLPFVYAASKTKPYKANRYSVTDLLGGTCEAVLKRRHQSDVVEDVSDMVFAILGTAVHKVLEESCNDERLSAEKWICVDIDGFEISGIPDLYNAESKTVTDWKITSVRTAV